MADGAVFEAEMRDREVVGGRSARRIELGGALESGDRLLRALLQHQDEAVLFERGGVVRRLRERGAQPGFGAIELTDGERQAAERRQGGGGQVGRRLVCREPARGFVRGARCPRAP